MGGPDRRSGMPGSFSTVIAHMEPPSSRKQAKRVRLVPERPFLGPWRSSEGPGWTDLVPTARDWSAWVGFMVTKHFDLVSGPFHSPIFIGLHSVSTSANMYHLDTRAGELPRSASSQKVSEFIYQLALGIFGGLERTHVCTPVTRFCCKTGSPLLGRHITHIKHITLNRTD